MSQLEIARGAAAPAPGPVASRQDARVVAVAAGKGGVGTSTVAALLGAAVAASGRQVLLVDAVGHLGTLHALLGVAPAYALGALRAGVEPRALVAPVSSTLSLLALAADASPLPESERRVLAQRLLSVYGAYDLVVADVGASAAAILEACRNGTTRLLAVCGADRVGLAATFALLKLVGQHFPDVRVDLMPNRVTDEVAATLHGHLNAAAIRFLSRTIHLAGAIPEDQDFGSALTAGLGALDAAVGSNAVAAMHDIGERLLDDLSAPVRAASPTRSFRTR
jgi:MinD-like ATPase involved in chromosome partitioning or flagellar assembly